MHRLAPPGVDPLAPEAPLAFVFSPLVGHAAHDEREVRGSGEVAAHGAAERRPRLQPLRHRGQAHRQRRHRRARRLRGPVGAARRRDGARVEQATDLWGLSAADAEDPCASGWAAWRVAAIGPAGERSSASRPSRTTAATPAAAGSAPCWAPRTSRRWRSGAGRKLRSPTPRPCWPPRGDLRAVVRPGHREVPRARHAREPPPSTRSPRCPRGTSARPRSRTRRRLAAEELARAAPSRARQLRLLHDRLRAHLRRAGRRHHPRRVRERVRARPALRRVRPRRGARRQRALRRARHRHDLRRQARSPGRWSAPSAA